MQPPPSQTPYGNPPVGAPPGAAVPYDPAQVQQQIDGFTQKSFLLGVPGLVLQVVGNVVGDAAGGLISLVGTGLLVGGLAFYAKSRGQSGLFGFFGLLSCIGLVILLLIPRKCLVCGGSVAKARCQQCGAPGAK